MIKKIAMGCLLVSLAGCCFKRHKKVVYHKTPPVHQLDFHLLPAQNKPITIFVHGGAKPISYIFAFPGFYSSCPRGLVPIKSLGTSCSAARKVARTLDSVAPSEFPLDAFSCFGWSGLLSFKARLHAGRDLYKVIRLLRDNPVYSNTPITLIAHSHGGNVALNVAAAARENNDEQPLIDRLILMACPVMVKSDELANSQVFKKVFVLYSKSDLFQTCDPQGFYPFFDRKTYCAPLFSQRRFKSSPRIVQAEIKFNQRSTVGHIGFVSRRFLRSLPDLLTVLSDEYGRTQLPHDKHKCYCLSINTKTVHVEQCRCI